MTSFRPPFTAHDIPALKKKIELGIYDSIPSFYSRDLEGFIRQCLTVDPRSRPSAEQLLHRPVIRKRIYLYPNEKFNEESLDSDSEKENKLIKTIRVSNGLNLKHDLKVKLPRSNYENN